MLLDRNALFFDDVAFPTAGTTRSSSYDLGAAGAHMMEGDLVRLFCMVSAGDVSGGTNALIQVINDDASDLASGTVLYATPVVLSAALVAGYRFNIPAIPVDNIALQYIGLSVTTTGTAMTVGKLTGGIITGDQTMGTGWKGIAAETGFNR